ncbi:MAG: hypothetical protein QHH09_00355 [Microgenomates group bacterium]|nr:hypothetical protein [Microgenomates group bacterium]
MKNYFLILVFAFGFLFLSYVPNFYEVSLVDQIASDRTIILGEHIYPYDYNVYLSKIRQGAEGRLTVVDKYDNNPSQKGVFLQMFYLLSGKVGGFFRLEPGTIYFLMRLFASVFWLLTIVFLNILFLRQKRFYLLGIILCLLSASWPVIAKIDNQFWLKGYMDWWQEMDVLKRISFLPHDVVNYLNLAFLNIFLYFFSITNQKKYFFFIAVILFFSFFIHPAAGLTFLISWFLFHFIKFIFFKEKVNRYKKNNLKKFFLTTLVLVLVSLIPLFYIKTVVSAYPWKTLVDFDQYQRLPFSLKEYFLALGPILISGFFGIFLVFLQKNRRFLILTSWFLSTLMGMVIFTFFPWQSPMRFVQTANHIPLAILSVYFFEAMLKRKKFSLNLILYILITITIVSGGLLTFYSLKSQNHFIHQRVVATIPLVPYPPQVMYPLTDFYQGLKWLEKNTDRQSIVLSKITAGNYIPAYAGNFVFFGHVGETPHFFEREKLVNNFFSGLMNPGEAKDFLKKEGINYIFYGPQEKDGAIRDIDRYDFIKPVFKSNYVTIYSFTKE